MNKKAVLTSLLVATTLWVLDVSCAPEIQVPTSGSSLNSDPITPTPKPRPVWLTKWLDDPACDLPCWEMITPGGTTRQEAMSILAVIPGTSHIEEDEVIPYGRGILWERGAIFFDDNEKVRQIEINVYYLEVTLKELTARFGEPRYVVINNRDSGGIAVDLAYPENGLVIELYLDSLGSAPDNIIVNIDSRQKVDHIVFYVPGLEYYYSDVLRQPVKKYDWKGYTTYP